jgi:hypothetical protein
MEVIEIEEDKEESSNVRGIEEAAELVGVSHATILRWLKSGMFEPNEAIRTESRFWLIDKGALLRVQRAALARGRGSFKARHLRFYDAPTGYVTVRLNEISDPILLSTFYGVVDSYQANLDALGAGHRRVAAIEKKLREIQNELTRRNLKPEIPENIKSPPI